MLGRIIPGALSPYFGAVNMATLFTISTAIVIFSMITVKTFLGTVFFGLFFGLFSGASIALSPAIVGVFNPPDKRGDEPVTDLAWL